MFLISTSDPDVKYLVGQDFESSHYAEDIYNFESARGSFRRSIKRVVVNGDEYTMAGTECHFCFRLKDGEKLVMGETVMEEPCQPAPQPMVAEEKKGFLSSLLKKLAGRK